MESAPKTTWAAGSDGRADVGGNCSSGADAHAIEITPFVRAVVAM